MKEEIFRPRLSGWIMGMYWTIMVFFIALMIIVPVMADMGFLADAVFISVFATITLLIVFVIFRAHRMKFVISKNKITVHGVFKKNIINISDIEVIQKTPIPFGFRLYGASGLGGLYYLPGIGKAWVTMGNFSDGVMIITKQNKKYVITPMKPLDFIKAIKKR